MRVMRYGSACLLAALMVTAQTTAASAAVKTGVTVGKVYVTHDLAQFTYSQSGIGYCAIFYLGTNQVRAPMLATLMTAKAAGSTITVYTSGGQPWNNSAGDVDDGVASIWCDGLDKVMIE